MNSHILFEQAIETLKTQEEANQLLGLMSQPDKRHAIENIVFNALPNNSVDINADLILKILHAINDRIKEKAQYFYFLEKNWNYLTESLPSICKTILQNHNKEKLLNDKLLEENKEKIQSDSISDVDVDESVSPHHLEEPFVAQLAKAGVSASESATMSGYVLPGLGVPLSSFVRYSEYLRHVSHGFGPAAIGARSLNVILLPFVKTYQYARHKLYGDLRPTISLEEGIELGVGITILAATIAIAIVTVPVVGAGLGLAMAGVGMLSAVGKAVDFWRGNYKINKKIQKKKKDFEQCDREISRINKCADTISAIKIKINSEQNAPEKAKLTDKLQRLEKIQKEIFTEKPLQSATQLRTHLTKEIKHLQSRQQNEYKNNFARVGKSVGATLATLGTIAAVCALVGVITIPVGFPLILAGSVIGIAVSVVATGFAIGMGIAMVVNRNQKTLVPNDIVATNFLDPQITSTTNINRNLSPDEMKQKMRLIRARSKEIKNLSDKENNNINLEQNTSLARKSVHVSVNLEKEDKPQAKVHLNQLRTQKKEPEHPF